MSAGLPSLSLQAGSLTSPGSLRPKPQPPPVTFKPLATKAQKYARMVRIDRHKLQRPTAHFRNALKTTEGLERVTRQLEKRLEGIESGCNAVSFERLSAFRDAFDDVIKLNQKFGPVLNRIKEAYNEHILFMLSQQQGEVHLPGPPIAYGQPSEVEKDLASLRKRVHQLEVESRVLLHENERLSKELSDEIEFHQKEFPRIHDDGQAAIQKVLDQLPPKDYAARVEELQGKLMQTQDAISSDYQRRNGSVPLTVCHNLEQCLREVEIETQKHQRRNYNLREEIKRCEQQILSGLQERNLKLSSDLGTVLGM